MNHRFCLWNARTGQWTYPDLWILRRNSRKFRCSLNRQQSKFTFECDERSAAQGGCRQINPNTEKTTIPAATHDCILFTCGASVAAAKMRITDRQPEPIREQDLPFGAIKAQNRMKSRGSVKGAKEYSGKSALDLDSSSSLIQNADSLNRV